MKVEVIVLLMLARAKPLQLLYLEALLPRLSERDPAFEAIQQLHARQHAGYLGECRVDREWQDFLSHENYHLFHNLHLQSEQDHPHQLDTVLLTTHFAVIFEIKNITGTLHYSDTHFEFSRITTDGVKERFTNPFTQALRHEQLIKQQKTTPNP